MYNKNEYYDVIAFNDILPQLDLNAKKYSYKFIKDFKELL